MKQSITIRIIAPGVNRNCREIGINVANVMILRFASRVTSAHPHFFRCLLAFLYDNVGPSEVHNVHPIHPFLVKPPCRSNSHSERSNGDGARMFDNSDEPRKWQQYMPSCPLTPYSLFDSQAPRCPMLQVSDFFRVLR
jgi:hypothetical protein